MVARYDLTITKDIIILALVSQMEDAVHRFKWKFPRKKFENLYDWQEDNCIECWEY